MNMNHEIDDAALKTLRQAERAQADGIAERFLMRREFLTARVDRREREASRSVTPRIWRAVSASVVAVSAGAATFSMFSMQHSFNEQNAALPGQAVVTQVAESPSILQSEILAAKPGSVVVVSTGSLKEPMVVDKAIRLVAKNGSV